MVIEVLPCTFLENYFQVYSQGLEPWSSTVFMAYVVAISCFSCTLTWYYLKRCSEEMTDNCLAL